MSGMYELLICQFSKCSGLNQIYYLSWGLDKGGLPGATIAQVSCWENCIWIAFPPSVRFLAIHFKDTRVYVPYFLSSHSENNG